MPRFSVILPCYNAAATIGATIAALQAQTHPDWEAICIDDGSTDATLQRLTDLAAAEPRLRVLHQPNAGPSLARNRAADQVRGDILAFLDADDLWTATKLASVAQTFAAHPAADAVFGRTAFLGAAAAPPAALSQVTPGPVGRQAFLGENPACTLSNLSVRRAAFRASGGFDPGMRHAEDLEWCLRFLGQGHRICATGDLHVHYRASAGGLSADLAAMHAGWRAAIRRSAADLPPARRAAAEAVHLRYLARRALRMGLAPRVALGFAARGLCHAPLAFLGGRHRGAATLAACLAAPILPAPLRATLFA